MTHPQTHCSQCGGTFGPGEEGFSDCRQHAAHMKRLHILQHTIGADSYGRRRHDRNHFVTGEGSDDYPHCMALVDAGLMTRRKGSALSGWDDVFCATDAGLAFVAARSPAPSKLTRSQQRYDEFLAADSGLKFSDWLKARHA